ncbi:signal peptidase I [Niallia sp. MER TA 168]|uniref:signal peptidase I n=1 Tax=Niallia sp. MER TA 168 TaxID=2939568 RepID=UPI00255A00F9|nr:signal peptidase I [Niallia sp. MER TA 168]MCM3362034.1 signal peptidase I [Niallia sp. MER TA 168]
MKTYVRKIFIFFIVLFIVRLFIFVPLKVDGESMKPTLQNGDLVLINKFNKPERFSIVIAQLPSGEKIVKRVIGLPGETVQYKNNQLFINNEATDEDFLHNGKKDIYTEDYALKGKVPDEHLFVLGDNRQFSTDSRELGAIPIDSVVGCIEARYWSLNKVSISIGKDNFK